MTFATITKANKNTEVFNKALLNRLYIFTSGVGFIVSTSSILTKVK